MSNEIDWRKECARLQVELDTVRAELAESKERWERMLGFQNAPRLPVRGFNAHLDCVGGEKGKASTQTYTTVGWKDGDDGR